VGLAGKALQAGLLTMRHFFGQQKSKKIAIAPVFFFGSIRQVLVDTTCVPGSTVGIEAPVALPRVSAFSSSALNCDDSYSYSS
jgi:succinate-acetate transporter protein